MSLRRWSFWLLAWSSFASPALGHPVTVDGAVGDWEARTTPAANQGIVVRNASGEGELLWVDAAGDALTAFASPERAADIAEVAFTGDATHLYVRVRSEGGFFLGSPFPQLQIAIDLDRVGGSGRTDFVGGADTAVANEARWERLLQTRAVGPSVLVWDDTGAMVATLTAAFGADVLELAVPWSTLGLVGPPPAARFTVAGFREDASGGTVDIGGTGVSDAVDAVTDYGDPGRVTSSADELADQVVDFYLEAHFTTDGEVYAPLQIVSYVYDTSRFVEMVEVRNQSSQPLALDGFALGDEETPDGGEGMLRFPPVMLAPGEVYVVALGSGAAFTSAFGFPPNAEGVPTTAVPDMVPLTAYATGGVALANGGDELLLLGPDRAIVDAVTFEAGSLPGIVDSPTTSADVTSFREPITADTDDGSIDFRTGDTCGDDSDCGTCQACSGYACVRAVVGTPCDDGDACTIFDSCDDFGTCLGGMVNPTCADGGLPLDGGAADGGSIDGGATDGGPIDGGAVDGGPTDGGPIDGGAFDGGPVDGSVPADAGVDLGGVLFDGGVTGDAGPPVDGGAFDGGSAPRDGGVLDGGVDSDGGRRRDGGIGADGAVSLDASAPVDAGDGSIGAGDDAGGCSCRTAGGAPASSAALLWLGVALTWWEVRRRRV